MSIITNRFARQPVWAAVTEIFIGLGWLRAATAKSIDPGWWDGSALEQFLVDHEGATLDWYQPFSQLAVAPNAVAFSAIVLVLQMVAAASLLTGRHRSVGLAVGIGLNLHFIAAGAVNPSAFYLLAQGALALWISERRPIDRIIEQLPFVAGSSLAVIGFNLPFIRTLNPATVIDDPAVMMITVAVLTCLACFLLAERATSAQRSEVLSDA